jgi:hypothetical protein
MSKSVSKKQFMAKDKIKPLPKDEKERRWTQRLGMVQQFGRSAVKALRTHVPKGTAELVGTVFGRPDLGRKFAHLTGIGDYEVKFNSLMRGSRVHPLHQASFSDIGTSAVRMQKREVIGHVIGPKDPTLFSKQEFRLQVADSHTFPWLSRAAAMYSEYMVIGMVVSFESTSSNYAQELALGELSIGTQYNANMAGYTEMSQCQNGAWSTNGNPSENLHHGIECDPELQNSSSLYIRNPGAMGPPNLYDHGVVTVATQGLPAVAANKSLGRLVARYDILLRVPREPQKAEDLMTIGQMPNSGQWTVIWPAMTAPLLPEAQIATIAGGYADWLIMPDSPHVPFTPASGSVAPDSRYLGMLGAISGTANAANNNDGQNYIVFAHPGQRSITLDLFGSTNNPSFTFNDVSGSYLETDLERRFCTIDVANSVSLGTNNIRYSLLITTVGNDGVLTIKQNVADSSVTCYLDISPRHSL